MNRFVATGLLEEMRAGKRVVVVGSTHALVGHIFDEVAAFTEPGEKPRRVKGAQRIEGGHGRGTIYFRSLAGYPGRGISADLVFIEDPDHRMSPDQFRDIAAFVCASPTGEIIRA